MAKRLAILAAILLAVMNILTFVYVSQATSGIDTLAKNVEEKTNKVIVYEGKPGYTPVVGKDYFNGKDGLNAVSYSVTRTVIQEVPIKGDPGASGKDGIDGKDGADAPFQELRVNQESGDLESKLSSDKYWITLIPCSELKTSCPGAE